MFENVIVGIDGGEGGADALALAKALIAPQGTMTLAHIHCPSPVTWQSGKAAHEKGRRAAEELLSLTRRKSAPDARVEVYDALDPGRGLHELVEVLDADLLVIGSSRRGFLGRVLTGDDTRRALDGAPCAVAVAPVGYRTAAARIKRIGVGYDGSTESEHALGVARRLAADHDAALVACEVVFLPARLFVGLVWPDQPAIDTMIDEARARLASVTGVEACAMLGEPSEELGRFSDQVDLLVVGSRSHGAWGRLAYGSTARDLARRARCPLLVLTRGAREHQANDVGLEAGTAATL